MSYDPRDDEPTEKPQRCQCSGDMPGHCPGPANCPMCETNEEEGGMSDREAISYGSVCSGIEAASVAWHPLGWKPSWFAEIEPFPSAVLAHAVDW